MSTERIKQLHEHASQCYLSGDYQGAVEAWRNVLGLDPSDEQALGGLRMASQFVEPVSPVYNDGMGSVDSELDQGLRILDGLSATTLLDPEIADGTVDQKPEPAGVHALAAEEILDGWEMPTESEAGSGSFGLEPISRPAAAPAPPPAPAAAPAPALSAAAAELARRVNDLLSEARAKAEAGERDEALSILARLAILDEDNADAAELRSKLEAEDDSDLDKVEQAIIEGVAALEADRLDDAERYLREALEIAPEHREARHYLEKVAERRASDGEELFGHGQSDAAPAEDAVRRAVAVETTALPKAPAAPKVPEKPEIQRPAEPRPKAPRMVLPPRKILIGAGVGVLVLAGAWVALSRVGSVSPEAAGQKPAAPLARPKRKAPTSAPAPVVPANPEEPAKRIASSVARGHELLASGDFGGAVISFNEALALNPKDAEARTGLEQAGELYKSSKAEREALNSIKFAFRDGEYTSGLRLAYRLPPSVSKSYADSIKVAGWYNLAVVALRAGECREALAHLNEALEIAPSDGEVKKLREFASRYLDAVKDRTFLAQVEALSFRPMPAS